ncbi:hypothetical protein [Cerasicoccus frondis]|uniref:hypothetical protein n=1 Tax=Cerasicoccus frondis TaxID=490090 RepID=UPI002852CB44|nr:hypothetical protein [Cerasicoccus frondis]
MLKSLQELINWLKRIDGFLGVVLSPLTIFLTICYTVLSQLHELLGWLLGQVDQAVSSLDVSVGSHGLDSVATDFWVTVNTFFPLDLVFELGTILLGLKATMATVRIIKSFIPTLT